MGLENKAYIPVIKKLGLNDISRVQINHVESVFGDNFLEQATEKQKNNAKKYLHGYKQKFESGLAWGVWHSFGKLLSNYLAGQISKLEPDGDGRYTLSIGFNGHSIDMEKIKTLKSGSDKVQNGLFEGASFSTEDEYVRDKILTGKLPKILRSGFDEIDQLDLVSKGLMFLVGPRGYIKIEQEANNILYSLVDSQELNNSSLVVRVLNEHQLLTNNGIKPGIANPRSCLYAPNASHMVRMALDVSYIEKASPKLDFMILTKSLLRRLKRAVRVLEHINKKK